MSHPYLLLADAIEYPGPGLLSLAESCRAALAERCPAAAAKLEALATFAAGVDPRQAEEVYTRTFDLAPARTLDLGYQLFGETYKRGLFLVRMQGALREHGIPAGDELPDHLPSLLRLLATLDREPGRALADEVVLPAVNKLLAAFLDEENPWRTALEGVVALLQADFAIDEIRPVPEDRPAAVPPGPRESHGVAAHLTPEDSAP